MTQEFEYRDLGEATGELHVQPSLDGQTTGLTVLAIRNVEKVSRATGEVFPKWQWAFVTDSGERLNGYLTEQSDHPFSKAMQWATALNGGSVPDGVDIGSLVGKRMIATLKLKPGSNGFLLISEPMPVSVEQQQQAAISDPSKMSSEQRRAIFALRDQLGIDNTLLGQLRQEQIGKRAAEMTPSDADRFIDYLKLALQNRVAA